MSAAEDPSAGVRATAARPRRVSAQEEEEVERAMEAQLQEGALAEEPVRGLPPIPVLGGGATSAATWSPPSAGTAAAAVRPPCTYAEAVRGAGAVCTIEKFR